ncbi:MAG: tetratricopeptide repeat protein [Bacteroidota bacterium]|jgi:tetratricopeptide (TPR) repeat protein
MKIKPLYIYLVLFTSFIAGMVIFRNLNSSGSEDLTKKMPNDEIHGSIGKEGEMPSGSNVLEDARKRLEELKVKYEKNPNDTLRIREYADLLKLAHQTELAIDLFEKIISKDPKRIDIMLELTFLYFNEGNLDKADKYTNSILKIDKENKIGLYNSGAIAAARGDNAKAKLIWQGIVKKFPDTEIAFISQQSLMELEKANPK